MTEIWLHGGAGGVSARLADLDRVAAVLRTVATGLAESAARLVAAAARPGWAATGVVSPVTFATAAGQLARAVAVPGGLVPLAVRLETLGDGVAVTAHAYRSAEATSSALLRGCEASVARAAGFVLVGRAGPLVVGLAVVRFRAAGPPALGPGPAPGSAHAPDAPPNRAVNALVWELVRHGRFGQRALALVPPAVDGAAFGPFTGPLPVALLGARPGSVAEVAALLGLAGAASGRPWLHEPATAPQVRLLPGQRREPVPRGVADLVAGIPSTEEATPRVHLQRIDHAGGRRAWIVSIPGTSDWAPQPSRDPFDLTTDVQLMAGRQTAAAAGVREAMRQAGVRPGEPVLLAGHSQGGIIAADLAADPLTRREFDVTQVVTTGSPVAAVPIPHRVHVLSLEHVQDPVPQLDAATNPDRPGWLTVTADVDTAQVRALHGARPLIGHDQGLYRQTAAVVDASRDPSVAAWRRGAADFVGDGSATVTGFDASVTRAGSG